MPRFARIVPLCRTPVGIDAFDYVLPDGTRWLPGDLVRIPLRAQTVEGVILAILDTSPFAAKAKPIVSSAPLTRFGQDWVDLVEWLAARTFQSTASIAKAWLRLLPKKLDPWNTRPAERARPGTLETHWVAYPERLVKGHLDERGRTLIIAPFAQQAERLAASLDCPILLSDDPKTVATGTWRALLEGTTRTLVTTRVGSWLGLFAERLILLEPEQDEHKQDESSPRFDARLIAAWLHQRKGLALTTIGRTPPIHVDQDGATIPIHPTLSIRHSHGRSGVPGLNIDTLERLLENAEERPIVVIHPIRGLRARCQCRTCGHVVACARCGTALRRQEASGWCDLCHLTQFLPETCPRCDGVDFSGSPPGLELLKREWAKQGYPPCLWRDGSPLALDLPFPPRALVLVTEPHLLGGFAEDIRRTERLCRTYRGLASRVAEAEGELVLQVHDGDTDRWLTWLTPDGVRALNLAERAARNVFRYPPSVRLAKLLMEGSEAAATSLCQEIQTTCANDPAFLELRGPFAAEGRLRTRTRWVAHLLFRPETSEQALLARLRPWARQAKIDLDAVAFLR